jgi:hypothetical protein
MLQMWRFVPGNLPAWPTGSNRLAGLCLALTHDVSCINMSRRPPAALQRPVDINNMLYTGHVFVCVEAGKICLRTGVECNPLTPKLNPSAQRCQTRFFLLEILILEPCISLKYAWKTNKCKNYSFSLLIMYGSSCMFRHYIAIFRERSWCLLRVAQLRSSR